MNNFKIATSARNAACNAIVDLLDAGAGAATLEIRTGAPPANVSDADSGTLLGTLTFSDPAFGDAAAGVATASLVASDTNADASGTAGHYRAKDSNGNTVFQGTCGTSDADMIFDNVTIIAGGVLAVSSLTVTVPIQ